MNNNNKNFILNLFGSDVDFSAIATDNVPELDITADIWEEKLSFLMLWKDPEKLSYYDNRTSESPCGKCWDAFNHNPKHFVPHCRNGHNWVEFVEPCEKKKLFDYKYEEYSFWSHVKGNDDDNNRAYFCEDEEISLKEQCAYGKLPHYDKSLREYFKESGENSPKRNDDAISCNEIISDKFYDHFYPKQTGWRPPWHPYSGDLARLSLSFRFNRESGVGDCFVLKT